MTTTPPVARPAPSGELVAGGPDQGLAPLGTGWATTSTGTAL